MASYYSPDLFLDNIYVVVIFLDDGLVALISDYDSKGRRHQSGDVLQIVRWANVGDVYSRSETAVLLGWGECVADAVQDSRTYFRRLTKWHRHKEDLSKFMLLGHDVAGSEILFGDQ